MPVQNKSPVKKYTTIATRIAGISTRNSLMRIMIIRPMMTKMTSAVRSSPKLPRIERTIVKRIVLSKNIPQINSAIPQLYVFCIGAEATYTRVSLSFCFSFNLWNNLFLCLDNAKGGYFESVVNSFSR